MILRLLMTKVVGRCDRTRLRKLLGFFYLFVCKTYFIVCIRVFRLCVCAANIQNLEKTEKV